MHTVLHRGLTIVAQHPALWVDGGEQIVRDLVEIFTHPRITHDCLRHLVANHQRLIAGQYALPDGRGCLMYLLTEPLGAGQIRSKGDLLRFFGRTSSVPGRSDYVAATDSPEYQPAKWLVRLVDGQICEHTRGRYRRACELFDFGLVRLIATEVLQLQAAPPRPAEPAAVACHA